MPMPKSPHWNPGDRTTVTTGSCASAARLLAEARATYRELGMAEPG
jgi:cobalamin biosynthesis protein CbiD